jgi:phosphoribosylanthranilate isomerase
MTVRIKICCIGSAEEAALALDMGADALGLVAAMPSGPGVISEDSIASILSSLPAGATSFLLTSHQCAADVVEQWRRCPAPTIQLCDRLSDGSHQVLRRALPGVELVQVIHVVDQSAVDEALEVAPHVDALLLDSGNPSLGVKQLGGTGRVHDWSVSATLKNAVERPVFLAGGLNASNVQAAIEQVEPWGVDVCSGVRSGGRLDAVKLRAFVSACRG